MTLNTSTQALLIWIIVGALAGTLTSMLFHGKHTPITDMSSLGLGLLGAFVGKTVFDFLGLRLGLPQLVLSIDDLVAAMLGSLVLLLLIRYIRR